MAKNQSDQNLTYGDYLISYADKINLYKPFELTNVQQAYYLGRRSEFELGNISTHFYTEFKFTNLDIGRLEWSFNYLISRHLALRTVIVDGNKQKHLADYTFYKIKTYELLSDQELLNIRSELSHKVYNPETYPIFDIVVSKFNDKYILHMSFDLLFIDAKSFGILFSEWTRIYNNQSLVLPSLMINYRDYMLQYERIKISESFKSSEEYWARKLDDYNLNIGLPLIASPSEIKSPKFARITKIIPNDIWGKLSNKIEKIGVRATTLILAVYGSILSYWTGQNKVCINLTLSHRLPIHQQINDIIGDFTSLELFNYIEDKGMTITQKLKEVHNELWEDIKHNIFDGIDFQRLIRKEKSIPNNHILAPVVLTSILGTKRINLFVQDTDTFIDKSYQGINYDTVQTSQLWLDNKAYETKEGFVAEWDYVEQLFDKEVIEAMHNSYCCLIENLAELDWDVAMFPITSIPNKDIDLIETANSRKQELSEDTLFSRYERIIKEHSLQDNICIVDVAKGIETRYAKLLEENDLLSKFILRNANNSRLIGVLSEKGYNQVVATLSIMKAGYGYLPLNVEWPVSRIGEVLEQGNVETLLISKAQYSRYAIKDSLSKRYRLLVIEDILLEISNKELQEQLNKVNLPIIKSDNIAYVIFTSGSTGTPKGVTISHSSALNTIDAINKKFMVTDKDRILALSDLSFDLSVYDIFGMLAIGGKIIFPDQNKIRYPKHWLELVNEYQITIWNTVPQLASLLITEADGKNFLSSLRLFLLSGDWIPTDLPRRITICCSKAVIISLGGATEGSIWSIWYEIEQVKDGWVSIPYGVPMPNQKMYVLNYHNEHCPVGVVGELHIGGTGVALNYWGNDEKTNSSFIEHCSLGRLYKTGDLGKWVKDGYIEYIGRKDSQVKLNGYRVELSEIELVLSTYKGIKESVVFYVDHIDEGDSQSTNSRNKHLIGYYVSDVKIHEEMLISYLRAKLPWYMVPNVFVYLEKLPLTTNGKLDTKALPKPTLLNDDTYIAPRNDLEWQVCKIWSELLGLPEDKISIEDDFFMLGGHSILLVNMFSALPEYIKSNLELSDFFQHATINRLSNHVESSLKKSKMDNK